MALDGSLIIPVIDPEYSCAEATLMLRQTASAVSQTLVRVLILEPSLSGLEAAGTSSESCVPRCQDTDRLKPTSSLRCLEALECIANANLGSGPSRVVDRKSVV